MKPNKIIERLPKHLKAFIVEQEYDRYTALDHAVWRYVMRQNYNYLQHVAHESYIEGLRKTGITIDKIPHIDEMNEILGKIGWAAVTVDGFIPPAAFMEFQAYNVLVIAADIRQLKHIEYTPAPDIIHEAAGHAPIIADPAYAEYLRYFGLIGSKALSSAQDYALYEAIRHLSIIKEDPNTPPHEIAEAEERIKEIEANMGEPSEMARIRNLHWWTVEYGLIGDLKNPKIYGAGLLSSIGESVWCMSDKVKKLPYSIEAADVSFDITKPQPQLFVTPSFHYLSEVLDQFADTMALRRGGMYGLQKAIESKNTATAQLNNGVQISGTFVEVLADNTGTPAYLRTQGPTMLSYNGRLLIGHDKDYHAEGYGTPIGLLKQTDQPIGKMSYGDLRALGIEEGRRCRLEYRSGVVVEGRLLNVRRNSRGEIILMSFDECSVEMNGKRLFEPAWGVYDLCVGETVVSVFSGPADPEGFELFYPVPEEKTHRPQYDEQNRALHALYQAVRDIREGRREASQLQNIWKEAQNFMKREDVWLLLLEMLEVAATQDGMNQLAQKLEEKLKEMAQQHSHLAKLIHDGLALIPNVAIS